jgi:hypothetical protein
MPDNCMYNTLPLHPLLAHQISIAPLHHHRTHSVISSTSSIQPAVVMSHSTTETKVIQMNTHNYCSHASDTSRCRTISTDNRWSTQLVPQQDTWQTDWWRIHNSSIRFTDERWFTNSTSGALVLVSPLLILLPPPFRWFASECIILSSSTHSCLCQPDVLPNDSVQLPSDCR